MKHPALGDTHLMTTVEVAQVLRVDPVTVLRWTKSGRIPSVVVPGPRPLIRIEAEVIAHIIEGSRVRPDPVDQAAAELAEYVRRRREEGRAALCPRCATRNIDVSSPFGWCVHCTVDRQIENDERREREKARQRRWWNANGPQWRAERKAKAKEAKEAASA